MNEADQRHISVVVVTHRPHYAVECIDSLLQTTYPMTGWELIVADDAASSVTAAAARSAASLGYSVRYLPQNGEGGNAARNAGAAAATSDVVAFIDDDEIVPPDHLDRVSEHLRARPDIAGVGGPYRDLGRDTLRTCSRHSMAAMDVQGEGVRPEPRMFAGNFAVRAPVFTQVGPFNEKLRGWGDEDEWFHRAQGHLFLYDPDLWVYHRRDQVPLLPTLRYAFWQGRSIPRVEAVVGPTHSRPRWLRFVKRAFHGLVRGCSFGLVQAARELGAMTQSALDGLSGSDEEAAQ